MYLYKSFSRYTIIFLLCVGSLLYNLFIFLSEDKKPSITENLDLGLHLGEYLINTSTCKIPDLGPYNEGIMRFLYREKFEPCRNMELLTYVESDADRRYLKINVSLLHFYSPRLSCCYSNITRSNIDKSDDDIAYSRCQTFKRSVQMFHPMVKVLCTNSLRIIEYTNIHFATIPQHHKEITSTSSEDKNPKFSVVFIGIDSISRWHLERTMPKTFDYLIRNFHSLRGYNKIGENTFPNLMAILSGEDRETLRGTCENKDRMNDCYFIWNDFKNAGYITAYAENDIGLSTFNYAAPGFRESPTDYYYRPFAIAAERLTTTIRYRMVQCSGPENYGVRMLNAAKDFMVSLADKPIFGLFWMNSFSHDNYNFPTSMDDKVLEFLTDSEIWKSVNNTIIVFLSDHGYRYGVIRNSYRGWLEERLPYVFIHIPDIFKKSFPAKFKEFSLNKQKLTSPYDLYLTMQDILHIGNVTYKPRKSKGCPKCRSLFSGIEENRTCLMAGIPEYYCTCQDYGYVDIEHPLVKRKADVMIHQVNKIIQSFKEHESCLSYFVKRIVSANVRNSSENENKKEYLLKIETEPYALFEGIVEDVLENGRHKYAVIGDISRLNRYSCYSRCVSNKILRKFCYCKGIMNYFFINLGSILKLC